MAGRVKMAPATTAPEQAPMLISALRKKLRAALGYDPIRNRIGEGYLMGGEET